jgi:hypothetical protein
VANSEAQSKHSRRSRNSEAKVEVEVGAKVAPTKVEVGAKVAPTKVEVGAKVVPTKVEVVAKVAPTKVAVIGKPPRGSNKNVSKDKKPGDVGARLGDGSFNGKYLTEDQGSKRSVVSQRLTEDQGSKRSVVSQRLTEDQGSKRSIVSEDATEANTLWLDRNLIHTENTRNGNQVPGLVKFEDTDTIAERINEKLSEKIITNVNIEISPPVDSSNYDSFVGSG